MKKYRSARSEYLRTESTNGDISAPPVLEHGAPDRDPVAVDEQSLAHGLAVHEGPVRGAEVRDHEAVVPAHDLRVPARGSRVGDDDLALGEPAERRRRAQAERVGDAVPVQEYEACVPRCGHGGR